MNYYAYSIRLAGSRNEKVIGGCLHADSMDDAARRVISHNKLTIRLTTYTRQPEFYHKGRKVYVHVFVPPECFLDAAPVETPEQCQARQAEESLTSASL